MVKRTKRIVSVLLVTLVSVFVGYKLAENNSNIGNILDLPKASAQANIQGLETARALSEAFSQVAESAIDGVVYINTEKTLPTYWKDFSPFGSPYDFFFRFFDDDNFPFPFPKRTPPQDKQRTPKKSVPIPYGTGSGFLISEDGYIVTNNHVVEDVDKIKVKLRDGREFEAKKIGSDPETDVALIKIEANGLKSLRLGDSDKIKIGEWVIAIGNPFGLSHTVTAGIISAKGRSRLESGSIVDYQDFIQTDAAINPGNSGGPLLNLNGEVIGMNTAIYTRSGGYMGIGFAIPINMIKYLVSQIKEKGTVERGFLGVYIQDVSPDVAKWLDLKDGKGALVAQVQKDSPAEKAGLKEGDVIVEFNGVPVEDAGSFRARVASTKPGTRVKLMVIRNGERKEIEVEIGKRPPEEGVKVEGDTVSSSNLGITGQTLTPDLAREFGYEGEKGVIITEVEPGSPGDRAGLRSGDLIIEVNRKPVTNVNEFNTAVKETPKDKKGVLLKVKRGDGSLYVVVPIE